MKLTLEEKKIKIGETCGVKPVLVCWTAYKDDGEGGSCCMSADTKQEVEDWLARLDEGSWAKGYQPKALYRYPDYFNCLNACHEMEKWLRGTEEEYRTVPAIQQRWKSYEQALLQGFGISATAQERAEVFGVVMKLWTWNQKDLLCVPLSLLTPVENSTN